VTWDLALIALAVLLVAAISRSLTGTCVTPAMAFVAIGVLLGPLAADVLRGDPRSEQVRTLAEATLVVVLFSDAARIRLRTLRRELSVPIRLLGVGLPLTILAGGLVGAAVFPQLTLTEALVLAAVLAPTDAALGQSVVTEPRLPSRIRQGLNVESGLNDGICMPLVLIALAAADAESHVTGGSGPWRVVAEEIGYGIAGGLAAGLVAAAVVETGRRWHLIAGPWLQVVPVGGGVLGYGVAAALGGSGFIAAFVAGLLFGWFSGQVSVEASRLSEEIGGLLGGVTFLMFGAILLGPALEHIGWREAAYAVASLTAIRMVPVALAMVGSGARAPTIAFLGWFGPRGLASIVFAVIVVEQANLPGTATILAAAYLTIGLSVVAHGVSAAPLAARYVRWYEGHRRPAMESVPVVEHRTGGSR